MVAANPRGCFGGVESRFLKTGLEKLPLFPLERVALGSLGVGRWGGAAWGPSQQVLVTVVRMGPREDPRGLAGARDARGALPCGCWHVPV